MTKTQGERGATSTSIGGWSAGAHGWGAVVIHEYHMHEKLVFVDDDVLWSGSLNVLSFSDTQEVMERRRSRAIVAEDAQTA